MLIRHRRHVEQRYEGGCYCFFTWINRCIFVSFSHCAVRSLAADGFTTSLRFSLHNIKHDKHAWAHARRRDPTTTSISTLVSANIASYRVFIGLEATAGRIYHFQTHSRCFSARSFVRKLPPHSFAHEKRLYTARKKPQHNVRTRVPLPTHFFVS